MHGAEEALARGRSEGAFGAIAALAGIGDIDAAAEAYTEVIRAAYWDDEDLTLTTAVAYAGVSRLLAAAEALDAEHAHTIRSAAKGMVYNLASFTWPGWDEPGIELTASDARVGLAAARTNLAMAADLDKGDLALSRAQWMLGAHLLTKGEHDDAVAAFEAATSHAGSAGVGGERLLAEAFGRLSRLARGDEGADVALEEALDRLRAEQDGEAFAAQVTTARVVLGL